MGARKTPTHRSLKKEKKENHAACMFDMNRVSNRTQHKTTHQTDERRSVRFIFRERGIDSAALLHKFVMIATKDSGNRRRQYLSLKETFDMILKKKSNDAIQRLL